MNFFKKNFSTILFILTILCFGGYLYFILSPKIDMAVESQKKIDSLNKTITLIESEQLKLDSHITKYNSEVEQIDDNILKIKTETNKLLSLQQTWGNTNSELDRKSTRLNSSH